LPVNGAKTPQKRAGQENPKIDPSSAFFLVTNIQRKYFVTKNGLVSVPLTASNLIAAGTPSVLLWYSSGTPSVARKNAYKKNAAAGYPLVIR